jgi:membrane protein implicated in regulation of membrane protease activity
MAVFFGIRPFYMRFLFRSNDARETGVRAYIGNTYKVTETIRNMEDTGRVKIGSESWRAKSEADAIIEAGELVVVSKVEGSTVIVTASERMDE